MSEPHPLLRALDAVTAPSIGHPSGLSGLVVVCVRDGEREERWCATLHPHLHTAYLSSAPAEANVTVTLSAQDALAFLRGERPTEQLEVEGDRALFASFVQRYVATRPLITTRLDAMTRR